MKICAKCQVEKDEVEFPYGRICKACRVVATLEWRAKNPEAPNIHAKAWYNRNRDKARAKAKAARLANPERYREYDRRSRAKNREARLEKSREWWKLNGLKNKYKLSEEEHSSLQKQYEQGCSICGSKEKLHIDHNHKTGKVRSILCFHCNTAIGHFKEDPHLLLLAINYLESHQQPELAL